MKMVELSDDAITLLEEQLDDELKNYSDVIIAMSEFIELLVSDNMSKRAKLKECKCQPSPNS